MNCASTFGSDAPVRLGVLGRQGSGVGCTAVLCLCGSVSGPAWCCSANHLSLPELHEWQGGVPVWGTGPHHQALWLCDLCCELPSLVPWWSIITVPTVVLCPVGVGSIAVLAGGCFGRRAGVCVAVSGSVCDGCWALGWPVQL